MSALVRNAAVAAAAKALIDAVRTAAEEAMKETPPLDTQMCVATIALSAEVSDLDQFAPIAGISRALASMALAQGITRHQLLAALRHNMAPTYESSMARDLLRKAGRA